MHKEEVLALLVYLGACKEAIQWIEAHPSDNAETVYNDCNNMGYFGWLRKALDIKPTPHTKPPWNVIEQAIRNNPIWRRT